MSPIEDGGMAFPGMKGTAFGQDSGHSEGMRLRDYFAAKAMQALASTNFGEIADTNGIESEPVVDYMARAAYRVADAMLKVRSASEDKTP